MMNQNSCMGIIFPNSYDALLPQLTGVRLMASVPFAARYRMIDFVLSSMSNCGIDNISIMVNKNYNSLTDHLGSGREWDLVRKNGGLHVFPPYSTGTSRPYTGRVGALEGILDFIRDQKEEYVIITDANIAYNFDFNKMIEAHKAANADVTMAYTVEEFPESIKKNTNNDLGFYYTFDVEDGRVKKIYVNDRTSGLKNFSMNVYLLKRSLLVDLIDVAYVRGMEFFERDVILPHLDKLNVKGYKYEGYTARLSDMKTYFDENMKLIDADNLDALFCGNPVYTKIRDDNPTRYISGSSAKHVLVADGCVIEGEIENCVLFRGVKIGKGAKVKNCILMQDTVVEAGASVEYVIADKNVTISADATMKGTDILPTYIPKYGKA